MTIVELLVFALCALLNILIESVFLVRVNLFGIVPDTIIVAIVAMALVSGGMKGAVYGFVCGLLVDVLFGTAIGIYALTYMLVGIFVSMFAHQYFAQNMVFAVIIAICAYFFKEGILVLSMMLQSFQFSVGNVFIRFLLPSAFMTGVLCMPVYYVYAKIKQYENRRRKYR